MLIVLVAGPSGSGKTTVANKLINEFAKKSYTHIDIQTLSIDRYYKDQSHLSEDERALINYDLPRQLEWDLLKQHVSDLKNDKSIEAPNFDFATHSRSKETTTFRQPDILVIEGIHGLFDEDLVKQANLKIYIDTNYANCYTRRLMRDTRERGRSIPSVLRQFTGQVWPAAKTFILPKKQEADIIVDNNSTLSPIIIKQAVNRINQLLVNEPSPLINLSLFANEQADTPGKAFQQNQNGLRK